MKKRFDRHRAPVEYTLRTTTDGNIAGCLVQLLLIYFAVLSTVLCISTALAMTVPIVEIILLTFVFTLLFAVAFLNKITTSIAAGALTMVLLAGWSALTQWFDKLVDAVYFCYDLAFVIMKMRGWNYTSRMVTSPEQIMQLLEDEALVLSYFRAVVLVLALFYSAWYVALCLKRPRIWLPMLASVAVMVPGFTIGLTPSFVAFSMLLACAFGLYLQTLSVRRIARSSIKDWFINLFKKRPFVERFKLTRTVGLYGIAGAGASLVLMLLVALFTVRSPVIELQEIREYLDEGSRYIYNQVFYSTLETPENAIGSMIAGDTLEVNKIPKIHNVPVFYVTSKKNEEVYLRAWVSDNYREEGWTVLGEQDDYDYKKTVVEGTEPNQFAYQLHSVFVDERLTMESQESYGFEIDSLTLKARFRKSTIAHLPSFIAGEMTAPLKDASFTAGEIADFETGRPAGNRYTVDAFLPIITSKGYVAALHGLGAKYQALLKLDTSDISSKNFQTFKSQERSYYEYVKKHYMSTFGLTTVFEQKAEELAKGHSSQLTQVLAIEKYFRDNTRFTYTTRPERLLSVTPMQQIEYSLDTKYEGYCTYYATAMTLMVRKLGYPARYVTGYRLQQTDKEQSGDVYKRTVMDSDAHAWVEVYFDGLGWMSFDPTPQAEETAEKFSARYYALELEMKPGDGKDGENALDAAQKIISVAEQPDDDEIMPPLAVDYGLFGGGGLRLVIAVAVILTAILLLLLFAYLYFKSCAHARRRYEGIRRPDGEGNPPTKEKQVRRMHRLILRWLQLKKMTRLTEETEAEYARRIDEILDTERSFCELVPIFQKAEFGKEPLTEEQLRKVELYYNELYYRMHKRHGKLAWYQKSKV